MFRRERALYRRLSHTKCSTSGLESSTPHRTGDKTTLLDSKCRPSRLRRIFFPILPDSKTYYEFILGWSAAMARNMPMFITVLYQFAMLTLNSYEKVRDLSNILLKFPPITVTKTYKTMGAKSGRGCCWRWAHRPLKRDACESVMENTESPTHLVQALHSGHTR